MKGYVPFVTVTKLGMKIISYKIVRPILRLETYFSPKEKLWQYYSTFMVMKIKLLFLLLLLLLLLRARRKKQHRGKEHTFLSEYGYSTGCPNLMWRGLQYSSPRHISWERRSILAPPPLMVFASFHVTSKINQHGGGRSTNFCHNYGYSKGCPSWVWRGLQVR